MNPTLRHGVTSPAVRDLLRPALKRVGSQVWDGGDPDLYDGILYRVVLAYQQDRGLVVDGIVGPKTWASLAASPDLPPSDWPRIDDARASRLWEGIAGLWGPTRFRMVPEYRQSRITAWERMEAGKEPRIVVPLSSDGSGKHGATCGHAAWLLASWWMCADRPTWRTGRGPTSSMPLRCVWKAPYAGVVYGGATHKGLAEYVERTVGRFDLRALYQGDAAPWSTWWTCQKDSGHVVTVVLCTPSFRWTDHRTGLPARFGAYRLAADGSKATIGRPWTFRRCEGKDPGPWTCYGFRDLLRDGTPDGGPLAGRTPAALVMEG